MMRAVTALCVFALFGIESLGAAVPINERRDVASDALIEIALVSGSVRITGWDKSEMELTGSLGDEDQRLEISGGKNRLKIEVRLPKNDREPEPSTLVLRAPRGGRIEVDNVSGPITVADMASRIEINSVSGDLVIKGKPRELTLNTVSGEIKVDDGESVENAEINSVSGSIDARLRFRPGASFAFETVSGGITLRLPDSASAEFEISTFSGGISSDFGDKPVQKSSFLSAKELVFSLGSGGARVEVSSFSGQIKLVKE